MITRFDDFCIHQTAQPVAEPAQSDRNFYDRYWFNGMQPEGEWVFGIGLGLYPNRRVMDGHFSVVIGDKQYAFHGSRRAPKERGETVIGPLSLEIVEPLRQIKVTLAKNEHDIECELLFTACSIAHEEPQNVLHDDGHLIMHNTRFTQMGHWQGYFSIDGKRYEVNQAVGTRDKSWGVRPVGEPAGGAPGLMSGDPGVYWLWNPINFGDFATHFGTFEDRDGNATQLSADIVPLYANPADIPAHEEPGLIKMVEAKHRVEWHKGTRRAAAVHMHYRDKTGKTWDITMRPIQRFYMLGIGYTHFEWGHAYWKGELETGREEWNFADINELDYQFLHTQQLVSAELKDSDGNQRKGLGTLESLVIGRHAPSGFKDYFDGAE